MAVIGNNNINWGAANIDRESNRRGNFYNNFRNTIGNFGNSLDAELARREQAQQAVEEAEKNRQMSIEQAALNRQFQEEQAEKARIFQANESRLARIANEQKENLDIVAQARAKADAMHKAEQTAADNKAALENYRNNVYIPTMQAIEVGGGSEEEKEKARGAARNEFAKQALAYDVKSVDYAVPQVEVAQTPVSPKPTLIAPSDILQVLGVTKAKFDASTDTEKKSYLEQYKKKKADINAGNKKKAEATAKDNADLNLLKRKKKQ